MQTAGQLLKGETFAAASRCLGLMAFDPWPSTAAQLLKRAEAFPENRENVNADIHHEISQPKHKVGLLPPVSKKQQRLQTAAFRISLETPDHLLSVSPSAERFSSI